MGWDGESIGVADVRSTLAWWIEAGVDASVQEEPRDWLKPPPSKAKADRPSRSDPSPEPANIKIPDPRTLEALKDWLATGADIPLVGTSARRALPHGPEEAEVMLLSEAPGSGEPDRPIGGEAWQLTERMLAAIGFSGAQAYSASLSCVQVPGKKMTPAERELCAEIARRHIRLARPKRLLLLGDGPCLALLAKRLVDARGHVHKVEGVRTVVTFHPRHLGNRPLDKALAWRDLLLLMEDEP